MRVGPNYRLRMSQALFWGWLAVAFTVGHGVAIEIEVKGAWGGWRWVAVAVCVVFPPLWARWVWEHSPRMRARRARLAESARGGS